MEKIFNHENSINFDSIFVAGLCLVVDVKIAATLESRNEGNGCSWKRPRPFIEFSLVTEDHEGGKAPDVDKSVPNRSRGNQKVSCVAQPQEAVEASFKNKLQGEAILALSIETMFNE